MRIELTGTTALVTGSTAGIGFAIAKGLAASGAEVVINGRGKDRIDTALAKLRQAVPTANAHGVVGDVATIEGCDALLTALPEVDILVNNAGLYEAKDFFEIQDEDWHRLFEINVMSGVRLARAYMRGMLARDWGRVIFMSSGVNIATEMIHFGATKTAQLALSRGLATLTRGTGVTVNSVLPGPTMSEGAGRFVKSLAARNGQSEAEVASSFVRQHYPESLLQRFATADEVANMVVYVASKQAAATNGAALRVEGGIIDTIA
jgi:NAD(P)-dependent dehydrogenase (short-subunit alcohol dehydrogenase family)